MSSDGSSTSSSPASATVLASIGVIAIGAISVFRPLRDFDLPWNLATGRIIWTTRTVPRIDDLAFTHGNLRYVEALADLILFGIYRSGRELGLQVVGAIIALALLLVVWAWLRRLGPIRWLAMGTLAATVVPWCELRPATVSFLLVVVTLMALSRHRERPKDWHWLALLSGTQWVWANTHGFAALGAALIAAYAAYRLLAKVVAGRLGAWLPFNDGADCARSVALCLMAAGATCLNTAGPALLLGPFRFDEDLSQLTEWARPNLDYFVHQQPIGAVVLIASLLAFALGREPTGARAPSLFSIGLAALALLGTCTAVRLLPIALLVLVPLAAQRIARLVRPSLLVSHACGLAPLLAAGWLGLSVPLARQPGFDPTWLPVDAVRAIERLSPAGRLYNFMPFGGYLAWRLHPRYRVFMDGRNQLARPVQLVRRATQAERDPEAFESLAREFDFQWAVTRAAEGEHFGIPLARNRGWAMSYLDDVAAIYVRRDGANQKLSTSSYRILRHLTTPAEVLQLATTRPDLGQALLRDATLAVQQAPNSARAAFFLACGALSAGDRSAFVNGLERLDRIAPGHPAIEVLLRVQATRLPSAGALGAGP